MSRGYAKIHPKYINGRCRNEPVPMEKGELDAMTAEIRSSRTTDGKTRKERRAEYVRARKAVQNPFGDMGGEV